MNNTETYSIPIGRYYAEVPRTMELTDTAVSIDGIPIKFHIDILKQRAEQLVENKWKDITSKSPGYKSKEKPPELTRPQDDMWLISYNFTRIDFPDFQGQPMKDLLHSSLGFFWKKNTLLEVGGEQTLEDSLSLTSLMSRFTSVESNTGGFCFVKGCIAGENNEREDLSVSFSDKKYKGLSIAFNVSAYQGERNSRLFDRKPSLPDIELPGALEWLSDPDNRTKTYRKTTRTINGIEGDEIVQGVTQVIDGRYLTEITGVWYAPGIPEDTSRPELKVTINYSYLSDSLADDAPCFPKNSREGISEEQFFLVWNSVLESLHPRIETQGSSQN